jgi:C4-dicarboxylate-specific signal transduction histidine kinase
MIKVFGFRNDKSLGYKILVGVLLISGIATCLIASFQLYHDYSSDVRSIEARLSQIESSYLKPVVNSIWEMNDSQVQISLEGIVNLPDIESVVVITSSNEVIKVGKATSKHSIIKKYKLSYVEQGVEESVGELVVHATLENAIARLKERIVIVFLSQAAKTLVTSFFILILVKFLVTIHVEKIALYFKQHDLGTRPKKLKLKKRIFNKNSNDEIDSLVVSVNEMFSRLENEFNQRVLAEKELTKMNFNLEKLIDKRTKQLVEANKLATLGEMAGGVAHEINSPLSVVHGLNNRLLRLVKEDGTRDKMITSLVKIGNLVDRIFIITKGLGMFSKDSSQDKFVEKDIFILTDTIVKYANARFLKLNVKIYIKDIDCNFQINCQEATVAQIINTLISNAVHRVKDLKENWISLSLKKVDEENEMWINDGSKGLNTDVKKFIENPFSARRGVDKGSGLELSLLCGMIETQNIKIIFGDGSEGYKYRIIFNNAREIKAA